MLQKQLWILGGFFLACLGFVSCGGEETPDIVLREVACQPEDIETEPPMEAAVPPAVGEVACAHRSAGIYTVHFRRGRVVVSILQDSFGFYLDEVALAVDGRLQAQQ